MKKLFIIAVLFICGLTNAQSIERYHLIGNTLHIAQNDPRALILYDVKNRKYVGNDLILTCYDGRGKKFIFSIDLATKLIYRN